LLETNLETTFIANKYIRVGYHDHDAKTDSALSYMT
jgi:hypothetical protein